MERSHLVFVCLFVCCLFYLTGCWKTSEKPMLTTKPFYQFYPGDLSKVDSIEIRSGSTGELKVFNDVQLVQAWIQTIRNTSLVPDPNQEDRTGFLYTVSLLEGIERKFSFTPNRIDGHYYMHNEELRKHIQELFEQ